MNKTAFRFIVIAIVALGAYWLFGRQPAPAPVVENGTPAASEPLIVYSETGFAPSELNVKVGTTVTFRNDSQRPMWPASAIHPEHSAYSGTTLAEHCPDAAGTAFDACAEVAPGKSWTFKFEKAGTWAYHDHVTPQFFGRVAVEE